MISATQARYRPRTTAEIEMNLRFSIFVFLRRVIPTYADHSNWRDLMRRERPYKVDNLTAKRRSRNISGIVLEWRRKCPAPCGSHRVSMCVNERREWKTLNVASMKEKDPEKAAASQGWRKYVCFIWSHTVNEENLMTGWKAERMRKICLWLRRHVFFSLH